tara:strand:+ start:6666 stop:7010 length:345 start_codon:yes stop_codon:yes gene_type:complete
MVFLNRSEVQRKRDDDYRKKGISPKGLALTTELNSKSDLLNKEDLLDLIEQRLGSTGSYQEQENAYVIQLLGNCLGALSITLEKYVSLSPNIISNNLNKNTFNQEFVKHFGYFV